MVSRRNVERIAAVCRLIETADHMPALDALARHVNLSAYHMHRLFKEVTGVTPRAYAAAYRMKRVRHQLENSEDVTQAVYAAGYNSSGRFYEESDEVLGMTPRDYRLKGASVDIYFAVGTCSLGAILVAQSARGVCAILLGDDPEEVIHQLQDQFPAANLIGGDSAFERRVATVVGFIEAPQIGLDLPLDIQGTAFQHRIWAVLRKIPPGQTLSYAEVARLAGMPKAVRAVASACAANPLAVAIPCHRVIRSDGAVSGYRWGVARKQALLEREAGINSNFNRQQNV